jgi:U3 small nucleolar RNA-associated protein 22
VYLAGSAASHGCLRTSPGAGCTVVDVAVEVPKGYYQEKDYLDHRYHAKRLAYLQVLQQHVSKAEWVSSSTFSAHHADIRKPCLLVKAKKPSDVCLRVLLTAPANAFPPARLQPDKANLRHLDGGDGGERPPSPHYSQSILEDMFFDEHAKYLQDAAAAAEYLEDACVLLKVWAARRGLLGAPDGFNGFVLSMLMAHLVSTGGKLSPLMDALQLVKGALTLLSNPAALAAGFWAGAHKKHQAEWKGVFPLVFVGPCGAVNIGARVSKSAVAEFVHEAALSSAILERGGRTAFEQVFLVSLHPAARYDVHLHLTVDRNDNSASGNCDTDMVSWRSHEAQVNDIVTNALGTRAKLVRVQHQPFVNASDIRPSHHDLAPSTTTKKRKSAGQDAAEDEDSADLFTIWIGVVLDPENAFRLVDLGPSSDDDTLAKQFRSFWGDRAELRRFKDGRICESIIWDSLAANKRHHIPALAIEYTLKRNFAPAESVEWSCSLLDPALDGRGSLLEDSSKESSPTALIQCLDRLAKRMKEMKEVPLRVVNVQPLSPAFRGTDPFPPQPHQLAFGAGIGLGKSDEQMPVCPRTLDVLVQLEGSGRWPENSAAINKTKAAMALTIADQLRSSYATPAVVAEEAVDVLHEGYAIRLHINATAGGADNEAAEKHLINGAAHAGVIATISARFPAYGPATQVAERWISGHMLSSHVGDEIIELLVGYLFLHPGAVEPPTSREVAFVRFLDLLASHPWGVLPLFVDPDDEVTMDGMQELEKKMDDPDAPSMCISTPYDADGDIWTRRGPPAVVLKRAQALAARAAERLKVLLQGRNRMDGKSSAGDVDGVKLGDASAWESLFTPALMHYDIVLKLRRAALPFPDHALFTAKQIKRRLVKELKVDPDTFQMAEHGGKRGLQLAKMPEKVLTRGPDKARAAMLIGFDPLQCYLREAERRLGGTALLFADKHGGDLIGVALKPKMAHHGAQLPASLGDFDPLGDFNPPAPPSVDEILDELLFIGNGFVQDGYKKGGK